MHLIDPRFSVAGLIVGVFVGLTGVGGSSMLAPVLILLLGVKPSLAIGIDLVYGVPTKLFAAALHQRERNVDWRLTAALAAGGVPGALAGLAVFAALRAHLPADALEITLRHGIGVAILLACAGAGCAWFLRRRAGTRDGTSHAAPRFALVAAIGVLVGFVVSLTSIGSGSILLPLLILTVPGVALRRLVGSEIAFAALLVPLAAAGHASFGNVNWAMVAALLAGSLPGVWIGSRLCAIIGEGWLRAAVVGLLAFAGARLV